MSRPISTAAAVVDVACEDGKLNLLGVETLTCTDGSVGRWRRDDSLDDDRRGVRADGADRDAGPLTSTRLVDGSTDGSDGDPAEGVLTEVRQPAGDRDGSRQLPDGPGFREI